MHSYELARAIHEERQREIERRLRHRSGRRSRQKRSTRQAIGGILIRFGSYLAADGSTPRRGTASGRPETQL